MKGKIIKGIAGFYYVHVAETGVFECKAKGIFRKKKIKPLVGDNVEIDVTDMEEKEGNIVKIFPRKNELIRPAVANIDQAVVIFAVNKPRPNFILLDRFLVMMEHQKVETVLCFNKKDLADDGEVEKLRAVYAASGYQILFVSAREETGIEALREVLEDKTTAVAGPSGVGKSSLINLIQPEAAMETGDISEKIERGRHTTRHSELIHIQASSYIMDTPGFSSLYLTSPVSRRGDAAAGMEKEMLKEYFREFREYESYCRFQGCSHIHEPDCGVRQALADGKISEIRYKDYILLYKELENTKKY